MSKPKKKISGASLRHAFEEIIWPRKKLIGIVSASDILGISVEGVGSDERSMDAYIDHQFSIEGLMKKDLKTLSTKSTIADAAEILSDGNFHAVPVVDNNDDLVGLVTSTDLIRFLRDLF